MWRLKFLSWLLIIVLILSVASPLAKAAPEPVHLTLAGHKFSADHITVPSGVRFSIQVTNNDPTPDEFESPALRVEKIVVPGQTITVFAGPLSPGSYKFYDDYHPETAHGVAEAK